ncbi:hypothetical protein ABW19_dt0207617 [Dactylella cylindrospora]|nr:hypothetical protein ABW19_dt0207617 [Dactylella cylindrospora]
MSSEYAPDSDAHTPNTQTPDTQLSGPTGTPPSQATSSVEKVGSRRQDGRSLLISRHKPEPGSAEKRGLREFSFKDMDEFDERFEDWAKVEFCDPPFGWDTWEFMFMEHDQEERLSDMKELRSQIVFNKHARGETTAAFFLVRKSATAA